MPGASVAVIARTHGVNANQVFHWRKLYREGRLDAGASSFLPVRVSEVFETPLGPDYFFNRTGNSVQPWCPA